MKKEVIGHEAKIEGQLCTYLMESVLNIKASAFPAVEQSSVQLLHVLEPFSECTETKRSRTEIDLVCLWTASPSRKTAISSSWDISQAGPYNNGPLKQV